jgi:NADH-quinone oxidoreductase subunit C
VVYEPVKLTQDFRSFDFLSPWEGLGLAQLGQLPGDEKAQSPAAPASAPAAPAKA